MTYNPDIHHRRSIRLRGYDYSQNGLYFITICTQNRKHLFGTITNGQMALNPMGEIAHSEWFKTESMRPNLRLHEFIVMPNHIHGIIEIIPVGAHCMRPLVPPTTDNHGQSEQGRVQRAPTDGGITDRHGQSELGHGQHAGNIVGAHCMRPLVPPATDNHGESEQGRVQRAPTDGGITDCHGQSESGHGQHAGNIVGAHCMRPPDMPPATDNHGESDQGRVQRAPTDGGITDRHGQHAGNIVGAHCMRPLDVQRAPTVGDIVRGYKSAVTKRINALRNTPGLPVWQRNYHEHIIRNETAYLKIADYTQTNPQRWQEDTYHG